MRKRHLTAGAGRAVAIVVAAVLQRPAHAQRTAASPPLVFDGVTVVDVGQGNLIPDQRVVIAGNRIRAVGGVRSVQLPNRARVVDARGKYLIPGLWDMHAHTTTDFVYPLLVASGVTGMRDAYSYVPLDTMVQWWREILTGARVGPPRQLLTGVGDDRNDRGMTEARLAVRKAHGANFIKLYPFTPTRAAAVRRVGLPFGGHVDLPFSVLEASDSGMSVIDHVTAWGLDTACMLGKLERFSIGHQGESFRNPGTLEQCRPVAERFRRNGTWWVPTLLIVWDMLSVDLHQEPWWPGVVPIGRRLQERAQAFWAGTLLQGNWLRDSVPSSASHAGGREPVADSLGALSIARRAGMPILAGTDTEGPDETEQFLHVTPGLSLHAELAMLVAEGLSPLEALQAATLNPAKMLHATDSLGAVGAGKLADLVLLDADPLADITNTTTIRAVVANGRYYDRAALDQLELELQTKAKQGGFKYWSTDDGTESAQHGPINP